MLFRSEEKKDLEESAAKLKKMIENKAGTEELKKGIQELTDKWHKTASKMYQAAGAKPGEGPQPGAEPKKDDGVVDAEYEVVDDKDKKK